MAKPISDDQVQIIARVMHEAIRAFQIANGEPPAPHWNRAPKWMKTATIEGVLFKIKNPKASVSAQHDQWMETKLKEGWKFGKKKDGAKKTHPLLIPYAELPFVERQKDALVAAIITSLSKKNL